MTLVTPASREDETQTEAPYSVRVKRMPTDYGTVNLHAATLA